MLPIEQALPDGANVWVYIGDGKKSRNPRLQTENNASFFFVVYAGKLNRDGMIPNKHLAFTRAITDLVYALSGSRTWQTGGGLGIDYAYLEDARNYYRNDQAKEPGTERLWFQWTGERFVPLNGGKLGNYVAPPEPPKAAKPERPYSMQLVIEFSPDQLVYQSDGRIVLRVDQYETSPLTLSSREAPAGHYKDCRRLSVQGRGTIKLSKRLPS